MRAISRRAALLAVSMFAVAACGPAGGEDGTAATGSVDTAAVSEMSMGADDAPVTLVEYASWTCPHCLHFNNEVLHPLKEDYIDTGKVKFVFREFPTPPANVAVAGFAVARCAGEDQYFDVLDELFDRQTAILSLVREGGQVKAALQQVAANHGITDPEAFDACLVNSDIRRAIAAAVEAGEEDGVTGTPTVFINGEAPSGYEWRTLEGMTALLDEALGEDAPVEDATIVEEPIDGADGDLGGESGDEDMVEPAAVEGETD